MLGRWKWDHLGGEQLKKEEKGDKKDRGGKKANWENVQEYENAARNINIKLKWKLKRRSDF